MNTKIKVLVVDDSGLMRLIITDILRSELDIEIVGTAKDGKDAVEKTELLNPDVILLDMIMGEYDGIFAVKNILAKRKVPIIILSSLGNNDMNPILDALRLGAFDYLNKPNKNNAKIREISSEIILKIRTAANVKKENLIQNNKEIKSNTFSHTFSNKLDYEIIVIGSSTGGPPALETILTNLPNNIPIPIVIVQHMPSNFIQSFALRLDNLSSLKVKLAQKNEQLMAGCIYLAPGDHNLVIRKDILGRSIFDFDDEKHYSEYNNPSVNSLFLSVADVYKNKSISVILTGMGRDGADGMVVLNKAGSITIVQSKETCVVFGMPKEVVTRNAAKYILDIQDIAPFIVSCMS
jgi:two-component system chemotaxis response regulator CheB